MISTHDSQYQEKEQACFDDLPDELVILIFSHLSPEDVACRVAKVCLRWQTTAKDPSIWHNAVLVYNEQQSLEFQTTIMFAPTLARVKMKMFRHLSEQTRKSILTGCQSVKCLSFYPSAGMPVHLKLDILSVYWESLRELDIYIDDSYLLDDSPDYLFKILSKLDHLRVLTLKGSISATFWKLESFCIGCGTLVALDVSGLTVLHDSLEGGIPNPWQDFILCILEKNAHTLKRLSLPRDVFDISTISLLENKFVCSKIEELKICEMCLWAVKKVDCLRSLHVNGMFYKNLSCLREKCQSLALVYSCLFDWIENTPQFQTVKELTLEHIIDDNRDLILSLLKACKNLESLTLFSGCHSSAQLAFLISQLPLLKKLSIHHMPCLRSKHIELITLYLPSLTNLNLRHNTLTDGILLYYKDHIQARMPNLQLICDWGYWNKNGGHPWVRQSNFTNQNQLLHPDASSSCNEKDKIRKILEELSDYGDDSD